MVRIIVSHLNGLPNSTNTQALTLEALQTIVGILVQ